MKESFKTRLMRIGLNFFPAYRRTGARVTFISSDFKKVKIKLPLNWTTKNIVGTIFGGSIYAAVDPIYMVMFMNILGKDYIVWDKAAKIDFIKPGRDVLTSEFNITQILIDEIKDELENNYSITKDFTVEFFNTDNEVSARIEKTLYFRKR